MATWRNELSAKIDEKWEAVEGRLRKLEESQRETADFRAETEEEVLDMQGRLDETMGALDQLVGDVAGDGTKNRSTREVMAGREIPRHHSKSSSAIVHLITDQ